METYTYKLVEDEHGNIQCGDKLYRFEEATEEEKKLPEKFKVHSFGDKDENGNFVSNPFPTNEELMDKINEIIDYLKSKGE